MVLRVAYVREHFASPLLQFANKDGGKTFTLIENPGGSGQIIKRILDGEIDIAIALTDPLVAGLAKELTGYKIVGTYVTTPLLWDIFAGIDTFYDSIAKLEGSTMGISRFGSGSETMARILAKQQGWKADSLTFQVNRDIDGLIQSVNNGSTSAFMWEHFTTKPRVDKGDIRVIGAIPTPWPSWVIAATTSAPSAEVRAFIETLSGFVRDFDSREKRIDPRADVAFVRDTFGQKEEDVVDWLNTVGYPESCLEVSRQVIRETYDALLEAKAFPPPEADFDISTYVDITLASLT